MSSSVNEEKQEFKLSFKPSSSLNMSNNNLGSQWLSATTSSTNTSHSFLNSNQSPSSVISGFNDNNNVNINASNHSQSNTNNISMFNPMRNLNIIPNDNSNNNNNNILNISQSSLPTDAEVIFHKSVAIMIKSSMMESNTRQLTLKIEKLIQLPQNQQLLSITLTDEVELI